MRGSMISSREWSQQFETIKRQIQIKRAGCDLKLSEVENASISGKFCQSHHANRFARQALSFYHLIQYQGQQFMTVLGRLESDLKVMAATPMEYEM